MKLNLKLSMQSCMCWRSFSTYYCTLFKQKLQYFKGNAQSQAALSLWNITFFKKSTWIHRCWVIVCKKMLNPYPKCTLFALFCFNCCGIVWKVPKPSESWMKYKIASVFSQFGKKKAGTKCRSHEAEGSDLDWSGLCQINQDQTKTSRKQKKKQLFQRSE